MSINSVVNDTVTGESLVNAQKPVPPTISGYTISGLDDTALDPAGGQTILLSGTGFQRGATVTLNGSAIAVVTYVNTNQLSFTSPAVSAGTYTIYAVNADGGTAIYIPGLIYSNLPTWTTGAGSLGTYYETQTLTSNVAASGDAPVTYSLFSGALPTGAVFNANGTITGTAPVDSGSTTYSFTVRATDAQLQDSTRSFSLTINVDAVTWVSPANATTYTSAVDSAIVNVALSATDAAGYSVSYSANALPTGLTLTGSNIAGTPTVVADSSTLLTATAATTNRTAVRTINWSITVANDVYFEYNTLLIPGASTTFVDDTSTNNFAVTINGDTKPNSFNPYTPGYYSNYFDGSGDYLTCVGSGAIVRTSGSFTIEGWYYPTSASASYRAVYSSGTGYETAGRLYQYGTQVIYYTGGSQSGETGSVSWTINTWNHFAVTWNGTTTKIYINGQLSNTNTLPYSGTTDLSVSEATYTALGYVSNFRIVSSVVYAAAFTPPSTPLTAVANTSLLTCQSNRFIDNSTNNFTITRYGDTTVNSFDPFVPNTSYSTYGSAYFDGTGDTISVPFSSAISLGTGNFTMEAWCYPTTTTNGVDSIWGSSNYSVMLYHSGTSWTLEVGDGGGNYFTINGTAPIYAWNHMAVTRSGSTFNLWINGVSAGTGTTAGTMKTSGTLSIGGNGNGQNFTGYMTDFRLVKGTAVYTTAFTPPTVPLTAIANTSLLTLQNNQSVNNNVFLDNSTNNFLVTRNGNATQGTFTPYGGNWSNYISSSSDYLTCNPAATAAFGTGDFTVEAWAFASSALTSGDNPYICDTRGGGGAWSLSWNYSGGANPWQLAWGNSSFLQSTTSMVINQWNHCAYVRSGTTGTLYLNGVSIGTWTDSYNYSASVTSMTIGRRNALNGGTQYLPGYLSNLRVVKGTAVYTSAFTPSTTPLTPITNTSLLTCQSNRLIDNSINNFTITKNGDVSVQRFSPFNPASLTPTSSSGYFDGTGDYLSLPSNSVFSPGTSAFTIEFWYYPVTSLTNAGIFDTRASAVSVNGILVRQGDPSGLTIGAYLNNATFITSGTLLNLNAWNHVAIVRNSSNSVVTYVNGIGGSGTTISTNLTDGTSNTPFIGRFVDIAASPYAANGYISNFRMVKGVAVYTGNFTVPTSPLQSTQSSGTNIAAITGTSTSLLTCQSPTFIDNSVNNFTITAVGDSKPTQQNPFGVTSATTTGYTASTIGGSMYSTGNGSYLTIPANNNFLFYGDYTIECWVYFVSALNNDADLVGNADGNTQSSWLIMMPTNSTFQFYPAGYNYYINSGITPTLGQWYHIAGVRSGTVISLYVNGVLSGAPATSQSAATYGSATKPIHIYSRVDANNTNPAYIADVRITNGRALYTSNFVPPAVPLTAVQNTVLLNNMTSGGIIDYTMMNNMQTVGDAKLSTAVSKFGGSSMAFDGTGDYLISSPNAAVLNTFGTGNFTVEFWMNSVSFANADNIKIVFDCRPLSTDGLYPCIYFFSGQIRYFVNSADRITGSTLNTGQWYHVALARSGSSTKLFVDGTQVGSTYTDTNNYLCGANRPIIASRGHTLGDNNYNGYIDDLRITKGYARYTSNFTPPTEAFQAK